MEGLDDIDQSEGVDETTSSTVYALAQQSPDFFNAISEKELVETYSLARSIKFIVLLDLLFLIMWVYYSSRFWLLMFLPGPVFGLVSCIKFNIQFAYIYLFYNLLRLIDEVYLITYTGLWLMFLGLSINLFIMKYAWNFVQMLSRRTSKEVEQLLHNPMWNLQIKHYFYYF